MARIGVFICWCGSNISSTVDVRRVAEYALTLPGVVYAVDYKYTCSDPGQRMIKDSIARDRLTGVVVAACSPRMHEPTFRSTLVDAGLNPYLLEIANLREHVSWVHENVGEATEKAEDLVRLAVEKVKMAEPLAEIEVPLTKRALVVGGGIAGIQAALDIAQGNREVILVEREPSIGGHMAQLDETFPTLDCSQCIMTPRMVEVARSKNIRMYTYSEVESVSGFIGNFEVKIRKKARSIDESKCTGCGACVESCPTRNVVTPLAEPPLPSLTADEATALEDILARNGGDRAALIAILQDVSAKYNYLPRHILENLAAQLKSPIADVLHVATFFRAFSLEPRGKHIITVCVGTACHVRGAAKLVSAIERELGISAGQTTPDRQFTLETVNCLGACALGPVVVVDGEYHGQINPAKVHKLMRKYLEPASDHKTPVPARAATAL